MSSLLLFFTFSFSQAEYPAQVPPRSLQDVYPDKTVLDVIRGFFFPRQCLQEIKGFYGGTEHIVLNADGWDPDLVYVFDYNEPARLINDFRGIAGEPNCEMVDIMDDDGQHTLRMRLDLIEDFWDDKKELPHGQVALSSSD